LSSGSEHECAGGGEDCSFHRSLLKK
jgi:hypothetical protein